jgi:serine/threonine protein kinase
VLEYADVRPSFCAYCGSALVETRVEPVVADAGSPTVPPSGPSGPAEEMPEQIGGYRLLRTLGTGGMGTVHEGEHIATGRRVAVKLISAGFAASEDAVERFRREGRLAGALIHERCVLVFAADEEDHRPYIVMELMTGTTLENLIESQGPLPIAEAIRKVFDVIEGLQEAHQLGLVHRDVKPSNCFVEAGGRVKVGDFGLAKSLVQDGKLTRPGAFLGTPFFAAPEQIKGEVVDSQADVYSVAATLYYLLTGRAPFQSPDVTASLARIVSERAPSMRKLRPELPEALDRAVLRGLARDRSLRWRNLEEFRTQLLPFDPGAMPPAPRGVRFAAVLLDLALFVPLWLGVELAKEVWLPRFPLPPAPSAPGGAQQPATSPLPTKSRLRDFLLDSVLLLPYFVLLEGFAGWTLGKRWLRLRVCTMSGSDPPGPVRATLRFLPVYIVIALPWELSYFLSSDKSVVLVFGPLWLSASLLCSLALISTMRSRNGYRGLHEFFSGTRTIALPEPGGVRFPSRWFRERASPLRERWDGPEQLGPFVVREVLRYSEREQVLLGEDPILERDVWLWLRPADEPSLSPRRREVARPGRLRWLTCGRVGARQWDAFVAPPGRPLTRILDGDIAPTWKQARSILEQLSAEMEAAGKDGTLPETLSVEQVWVQPGGRVQLLDVPLDEHTSEEDALSLLRKVSVLTLEGKPREVQAETEPVRAPIPLHARSILDRLFGIGDPYPGVEQFGAELEATRLLPTEVTRAQRMAHLIFMTTLLYVGLMTDVLLGILIITLYILIARSVFYVEISGCQAYIMTIWAIIISVLVSPLVWIIWAFIFRGGFSFRFMNLAVVDAQGRRASRLRCAWRAFLFWAPVCGAITLFVVLGIGWLSLMMPLIYLLVAIRTPRRSLHDYLAGTYLVPK